MKISPISFEHNKAESPIRPLADFSAWLGQKIEQSNTALFEGEKALQQLAVGTEDNLHQIMLTLESAKIKLALLEQVRSRALSAYQTLMREQL